MTEALNVSRATRQEPSSRMLDWSSYLSGFVDGEGCFCVTFNRSARHRFGWDIRPSFSVSQNADRAEVLRGALKHFGCGTIRPDRSDKTIKFEVRSVGELVQKVLPHFRKFPLLSSKQRDFEVFAEICERMLRQEHLSEDGFETVSQLAKRLNAFGKKKYSRSLLNV